MVRGLALWLTAVAAASPADAARPVAVGYVAAFKGLDAIAARADFRRYTHINIAFANPAADGSFVAGDALACMPGEAGGTTTLTALRTTVAKARRAGSKVLVSLGGGTIPGCSGDWNRLLAPATRPALVRNLLALVDAAGLDGIDIDLEGELLTAIDRRGDYSPFIAELGAALHARGKLLTCATASYEGGMVPISSLPWFDLVNVMSYDAIGPTWGRAGDEHATLAQAKRDLALWRRRGVPRERLVLGVPFYGYGFGSYRADYATRDLLAAFPDAAGDVIGKRCAGCSYVTFNGRATLRAKGELARAQGAGIMVWEIAQDTDDFALIDAVNPDGRDDPPAPTAPARD